MGACNGRCFQDQPTYARYHSNTREVEPDLENVVGSILEMDPTLQDREEGVAKINSWISEVAPEVQISAEHLEINRWKCIKYWEAQHVSDIYGAEYNVQGLKLTGSCVRLYFERKHDGSLPRLVIEHCGRSDHAQSVNNGCIPERLRTLSIRNWRPFMKSEDEMELQGNSHSPTGSMSSINR